MSEIATIVEGQRNSFMAVSTDQSINFDREAGFAIQALQNNDYLARIAMGNKASLQAAVNNIAAIGISLNPASKQAYLVPRDGRVCLDISYMGMMHLAQQTGAISWGQAVIVRKNDTFELNGIDKPPFHKFNPFDTERGEVIGVYVVVKTGTGDYLTHAMPISKVFDIRDRSAAWKSYQAKGTKCPWVTDEDEMVKKTCVKQAAKYWPRRDRLDEAIHHMNVDGMEGLAVINEPENPDMKNFKDVTNVTRTLPSTGVWEALDVDNQTWLQDIADQSITLIDKGDIKGAMEHIADQNLDADDKVALNTRFDSKQRSAMKKFVAKMKAVA